VLEWYARVRAAAAVQKQIRDGRSADALAELRRRGVTHLVLPAGQKLEGAGVVPVHEDDAYRVYRLTAGRS
jgi:hypothetical protein